MKGITHPTMERKAHHTISHFEPISSWLPSLSPFAKAFSLEELMLLDEAPAFQDLSGGDGLHLGLEFTKRSRGSLAL